MVLIICLLAFCFLPLPSANTFAVEAKHEPAHLSITKFQKADQIAHETAKDKDVNQIMQFVHELILVAPILYPGIDYSMIIPILFGDQPQIYQSKDNKKMEIEIAAWINELTKTKKAIENDANDKQLSHLLHKLQQIMHSAMSALKEAEFAQQNAKIEVLKNDIMYAVEEIAKLYDISPKEIIQPLEEGAKPEQKSMLKEVAKLWNELKKQSEKRGQKHEQKSHQGTKRMLKLIAHFPIDGVDGLANLKRAKKRRRRRSTTKNVDTTKTTPYAIAAIVVIVVVVLGVFIYCLCNKKPKNSNNEAGGEVQLGQRNV